MKELVLFILTFTLVFIVYYILLKDKKKNKNKRPIEIRFIVERYDLDMKKIKYNKLALLVALVNAFDIALLVTIINMIKSVILQVVCVMVLIGPIIIVSYNLIGRYYKKKGMTKDES